MIVLRALERTFQNVVKIFTLSLLYTHGLLGKLIELLIFFVYHFKSFKLIKGREKIVEQEFQMFI